MNELELFLRFSFFGLSLIVLLISLLSLKKMKDIKIAFAVLGFLFFAIEGSIILLGIFFPSIEILVTTELLIGAPLIALVFLYLSILKR